MDKPGFINIQFICKYVQYEKYNLLVDHSSVISITIDNVFLRPLTNVSGLYSVMGLAVSVVHASFLPAFR